MTVAARLLLLGFRLTGRTAQWRSREALLAAVAHRDPWPAPSPRLRGVAVRRIESTPWPAVHLVPPRPVGTYVHLHGGGYVFGPQAQHWHLLRALALASGRTVIAPLYRLAPQGVAAVTVPAATRLVAAAARSGDLVLGGDSAGAGLALAVAQSLVATGVRPRLALVAPLVDAALDGPATVAADARDPWLSAAGLRAAADLYRGDLAVDHPFVSPARGPLAGLGPVTIITGTRDVLHPQGLALAVALRRAAVPVDLHVAAGMLHNPPFLPVPEARPYRRVLADLLRDRP